MDELSGGKREQDSVLTVAGELAGEIGGVLYRTETGLVSKIVLGEPNSEPTIY